MPSLLFFVTYAHFLISDFKRQILTKVNIIMSRQTRILETLESMEPRRVSESDCQSTDFYEDFLPINDYDQLNSLQLIITDKLKAKCLV